MTETTPNSTPAGEPSHRPGRCRGRGRGLVFGLAVVAALGGAFIAGKAMSHGFGFGGHHFGHKGGFTRILSPATAEEASERAARMARHLAVEVDANAEQEAKLITLAKGVANDVYPLRQQMVEARKKGLELMKAPTIDRAAVEALRSEQMAKLDAISKRLSIAIADAGEVLSPDQRSKLAARVEEFRERRGWWHRGPRH